MKMGNLHSTQPQPEEDDSDSDSDDDDEDEDKKPHMETAMINHLGSINRIRVRISYFIATPHLISNKRLF